MGVRVTPVEAEVKNLRSEMQAEAIIMGGFTFMSLVGTEDWVARSKVSSSPTLFLDIVSVLQVVYLPGTNQRAQLSDERSASSVSYANYLEACIAKSLKLTLPSVVSRKANKTFTVSL
jgi:hypothetical protein